jgi:hypothetical protein
MEYHAVIGIDPGADGAAVSIPNGLKPYSFCKFKKGSLLELVLHDCLVFIEKVGSMPKDRKQGTFQFGKNTGEIYGILKAKGINLQNKRLIEVSPQTWQRHFNLGAKFPSKTARKNAHKALAQKLFPQVKVTLDIADALLIATYGYDQVFHDVLTISKIEKFKADNFDSDDLAGL